MRPAPTLFHLSMSMPHFRHVAPLLSSSAQAAEHLRDVWSIWRLARQLFSRIYMNYADFLIGCLRVRLRIKNVIAMTSHKPITALRIPNAGVAVKCSRLRLSAS